MMTFAEADAQYELVKQRYQAGALADEEYDEQLRGLMVLDDQGRWWAKSRENGGWHYYDAASESWLAAAPPVAPPSAPPPRPVQSAPSSTVAAGAAADKPATSASPEPSAPTAGAAPAVSQAGLPKWAAVAPASVQQAGGASKTTGAGKSAQPGAASVAPVAGQAAPATPSPTSYSARDFGPIPELSGSLKVVLYILALLVPVLGFVLFFVYRKKPAQADRSAARVFLILGVVSLVFSCLASVGILLLESLLLGSGL